jgi:undecaprenyl-diphosphatase
MLDTIIELDQALFLFLNGLHHPLLDDFFIFITKNKIAWAISFLVPIIYGFIKLKQRMILPFVMTLILFGVSDSFTSKVMKPGFERLRPCFQEGVKEQQRLIGYESCGGKYGFVSSHAANTFAFVTFLFFIFQSLSRKWGYFYIYAFLIAYSRIYVGKHYPLDVIYGGLIGAILGLAFYKILLGLKKKLNLH